MVEVLMVAVVAVSLSLFAGNILAGNISESMLRADLVAAGDGADHFVGWGGGTLEQMGIMTEITSDQVLASYSVALDLTTAAIVLVAAIGTVIVATIIPMLYILRLNPRKIMM